MIKALLFNLLFLIFTVFVIVQGFFNKEGRLQYPFPISEETQQYVKSLSIEQKVGQMGQLDFGFLMDWSKRDLSYGKINSNARKGIGSYFNSPTLWNVTEWRRLVTRVQKAHRLARTPPPLIALDSVHGANYVKGAVLFPQPINVAATFTPEYAYQMGYVSGRDTMAAGIPWTFAPILDLGVRSAWSRHYETFGEDPYVVAEMGKSMIQGIQSVPNMVACAKHFIAYSATLTSIDRDPIQVNRFQLLNYYLKPYLAAIKSAGVKTVMTSYASFEGIPATANTFLTDTLLRKALEFNGLVVTDYKEVYNLHKDHKMAANREEAVTMAMKQTSIDMSMIPWDHEFLYILEKLVYKGVVSESRITSSVARIIELKKRLGLFNQTVPGEEYVPLVGNPKDQELSLAMATDSIVLLQNTNQTLPLTSDTKVFLTGHLIGHICKLLGGWSLSWQGNVENGKFPDSYRSIVQAFQDFQNASLAAYSDSLDDISSFYTNETLWNETVANVTQNDVTIIIAGEAPYAERPGDLGDLALPKDQRKFIRRVSKIPNRGKIVLVLVQGRPRLLNDLPEYVDAIVFAGLPGQFGGQALTKILYGDAIPNGKLPFTYPRNYTDQNIPYYRYSITSDAQWKPYVPRWPFGFGLSYTSFEYSDMTLSNDILPIGDSLDVSVRINNIGNYDGQETVFLFVQQKYRERYHIPEIRLLKRFVKVKIPKGEQQVVKFQLTPSDFEYVLPELNRQSQLQRRIDAGEYVLSIGPETDCISDPENMLCQALVIIEP